MGYGFSGQDASDHLRWLRRGPFDRLNPSRLLQALHPLGHLIVEIDEAGLRNGKVPDHDLIDGLAVGGINTVRMQRDAHHVVAQGDRKRAVAEDFRRVVPIDRGGGALFHGEDSSPLMYSRALSSASSAKDTGETPMQATVASERLFA